ncbi:hypothetical protein [Massilia endophytica]|uniref:hypothetical protein n=1 Tax=Massilia endophytica TaxID=2899220 RepID=UPI001E4C96DE|nr:hypothetical protein [Massilia endophytica]UGQ48306.1 hypothetical protein LSQ66_07525 [Massilia endophytica]
MRLPGTRYQEHGWEQVRKLLGQCSLHAFRQGDLGVALAGPSSELLDWYIETLSAELHAAARLARGEQPCNSYGDSAAQLSISLLFELQVQPSYWDAFVAAVRTEHAKQPAFWSSAAGEGMLRKKVNDMFATLRDKVDADNYQAATGKPCSPNRIYTYRMLDTAYHGLAQIFANWEHNVEQVGEILGREVQGTPIEVRQMRSIADCKPEWIINWSASLERFEGAPGPLHTKSKRFASLKNSPDKIGAMLREIGEYEALSANHDVADWQQDKDEAALWLEDFWRVASEAVERESPDRILTPPEEDDEAEEEADDLPRGAPVDDATRAVAEARAASLSLPLRYMEMAAAAQDCSSWTARVLRNVSLPIRLAVYHKLLGPVDDSYPDAWLDPETGELPTVQQLAALDGISAPTLRKRRDEAIALLHAAQRT